MLVFVNGSLGYFTNEGVAELDENGNPVVSADESTEVECYIETITENQRGRYEDGRYANVSYSVMINSESVPLGFMPEKVKLTHDRKGDLGVFTVQRIEFYDLTQTIQLWV